MKTLDPHQTELFDTEQLRRCSLPPTGVATKGNGMHRLQNRIAGLIAEQAVLRQRICALDSENLLHLEELKAAREQRDVIGRQLETAERQCREQAQAIEHLALELRNRPRARAGAIPKDTWRLLMQLVHPDKHNASAASHAAAKWLNENKPR